MSQHANHAIQVERLTKTYRQGFWRRKISGLSAIELTVERGEAFGLLGPNGAGKTTLFKLVTGLLRPTSGSGSVMGQPLGSPAAQRAIGYLPENPQVPDWLTGEQFLTLMAKLLGLEKPEGEIAELLDRVGLQAKRHLTVRKYSKGMIQRLALAQALLGDPPLLILDEPMSGLDPVGRKLVRDIIGDLRRKGRTVVFSSHILTDAEALCDRVGLMLGGKLGDVGPVGNLVGAQATSVEIVVQSQDLALPAALVEKSVRLEHRGGQAVIIAPGDEQISDEVLEFLHQNRHRILALQRHRQSLEEYFVRKAAEAHSHGMKGAIASS